MKPLLIYGSQDFGRVVCDLAEQCGRAVAGYVDDFHAGPGILGDYAQARIGFPPETHEIVIAIGYKNLPARWKVYQKVIRDGYAVPTLIHPRAYARHPEAVGAGSIVMAGAIADAGARLGELTVLWPGAVVNHDSSVGANAFVSPNATICGFVTVEVGCFIGAGAVIVDRMTVPAHTFVKAGRVYAPATQDDPSVARRMTAAEREQR